MRSINKVFIVGNITRDPELKTAASGQVIATFGVAFTLVGAEKNMVSIITHNERIRIKVEMASLTQFDFCPNAAEGAPLFVIQISKHFKVRKRRWIGENDRVACQFGANEWCCSPVRIAGTDQIGQFSRIFSIHHEIDELMSQIWMLATTVDNHAIQRHDGSLFRYGVINCK